MIDYSCKVCGGTLIPQGKGLAVCDSCRTLQTMSGIADADRAQLLDRAAYMRRQGKFSQAADTIEKLLNADIRDAESYWQAVLCRYGVIYEPDGKGGYHISCHRMRQGSILTDADYKKALEYADGQAAGQYKQDAEMIAAIQREYEAVMARCKPWDVAIVCDESVPATRQAAAQLYEQLRLKRLNVYLASRTAAEHPNESAAGLNYAAIHTAWAMVVVLSSSAEAESNQLRNQWATYRALNSKARPRRLIVAYQQMQLFDLPEELASLEDIQCLDEHGAVLDLAYGVERYRPMDKSEAMDPYGNDLRQAYLHLSKGEYNLARDYASAILQKNKKHAQALICNFLADCEITCGDDTGLLQLPYVFREYRQHKSIHGAIPAGSELKKHIVALEKEQIAKLYQKACDILAQEDADAEALEYALELFHDLKEFPDSVAREEAVRKKKEELEQRLEREARLAELEATYQKLVSASRRVYREQDIYALADRFRELGSYRDSQKIADELIQNLRDRVTRQINDAETRKEREKSRMVKGVLGMILVVVVYILLIVLTAQTSPALIAVLEGIHHVLPLGTWLLPLLLVLLNLLAGLPAACIDYVHEYAGGGTLFLVGFVQLVLHISFYAMLGEKIAWLAPASGIVSLLMIAGVAVVGYLGAFGISFGMSHSKKWGK